MATLTDLQTRLSAYQQAESEILTLGQSYALHGVSKTRADLREISRQIASLEARIQSLSEATTGGGRYHAVFGGRSDE